MNTFYVIRHGETENNRAKRLSGWIDTPLTDTGLLPTQLVINKLAGIDVQVLYSSDLGRAFVTAYIVARGIGYTEEIKRSSGLREVNYGEASNMLANEAYAKYPGLDSHTYYTPPGGESLQAMQLRVLETVTKLDNDHQDHTILLVCHSGVIAALNASFLGQDFGAHNINEAYPHDYVGVFSLANGGVVSFAEYVI